MPGLIIFTGIRNSLSVSEESQKNLKIFAPQVDIVYQEVLGDLGI